jgi:nickel transport protein
MIGVLAFLVGIWSFGSQSFAHHLWVQEIENNYAVCRGNIGKRLAPYNPSCVKQITAENTNGNEILITRVDGKEQAVFTTKVKPALVSVISEWGDRVLTTQGKKLMNRQTAENQGLRVLNAFTSTQFSKTLCAPSKVNSQVRGLKFELVPVSDPMTVMPGTSLAFQLLFEGQPLEGISIFTNNDHEYKTGAKGMVQIPLEKGVQLLYAIHNIPAGEDFGLDFFKFMTFVTFEVK